MADTIRTTNDTTANTTTAGYDAEAVRVGAATPMDKRRATGTTHDTHTTVAHRDNASTKGLVVGVLTFLLLSLWEWLDGPTGASGDAITFPEMAIYAVVGIIVGVAVKAIDRARHKKTRV